MSLSRWGLLLFLCISNTHADVALCSRFVQSVESVAERDRLSLSAWHEVGTPDVSVTEPPKYTFIVHGLRGSEAQEEWIQYFKKKGTFRKEDYIDLVETPERISEKPVVSTSVIDQDTHLTWGPFGFILKVPAENFVAASARDAGTQLDLVGKELQSSLDLQRKVYGLPDPGSVLKGTNAPSHNEVVLVGTAPTGSKIEIAAIFVKVGPSGGFALNNSQKQDFQKLVARLKVPVVKIRK
jgi:hypothetical protein